MELSERVERALRDASARQAALTDEQRREIDMIVLLATHLLMCCPIETLPGGDKHLWHRDLQPAIGSDDCVCKGIPLRVLGPDYFLEKRKKEAA